MPLGTKPTHSRPSAAQWLWFNKPMKLTVAFGARSLSARRSAD
jgi:hypothetical protein